MKIGLLLEVGRLIGSHDRSDVTGAPWASKAGNFDDGGRFEVIVKEVVGDDGVVGQSNQIRGLVPRPEAEEMGVSDEHGRYHQNLKALKKVPQNSHYYYPLKLVSVEACHPSAYLTFASQESLSEVLTLVKVEFLQVDVS